MNGDEDDMIKMLHNFFTVSLNVSFATHPNYREREDPTCSPVINKGITIKYDANMHYATTALSSAVFQDLCLQLPASRIKRLLLNFVKLWQCTGKIKI